jgi:hypothetical protein
MSTSYANFSVSSAAIPPPPFGGGFVNVGHPNISQYNNIPPPMLPYNSNNSNFGGVQSLGNNSHFANILDLSKMPVGNMCNIVRTAKKLGHPKYQPVDIAVVAMVPVPHIEPGRLEARVTEFYKALNALVDCFR